MAHSFLSSDQTLGNSETPQRCTGCLKTKRWSEGNFCANFGTSVSGFKTCQRTWCRRCYPSPSTPDFHVAVINPEADFGDDDMDRIVTGWKPKKDDLYRFSRARDGDDLLVPFECDICIFTTLYRRLPQPAAVEPKDALALACIRRINLDAFWSRASSTVKSTAALARTGRRLSASVGLDNGPYSQPGPLPNGDNCGYQVAIQMVQALLEEGRHSKAYKQWDTIRILRSVYSNHFRASGKANSQAWSIADNRVLNTQRLLQDPCGSFWFSRFMEGCRRRMGQD